MPPLDSDRGWRERKLHFMAGIDTRDAVEKYLQRLDQGYIDTIKGLGAKKGDVFSLWDTINRCTSHSLSLSQAFAHSPETFFLFLFQL